MDPSPVEGLENEKIRHSQSSLSKVEKHVRYSRHLSSQYKSIPSNVQHRLVIHTVVRSLQDNDRQKQNKSVTFNRRSNSVSIAPRSRCDRNEYPEHSRSVDGYSRQRQQPVSSFTRNSWENKSGIGYGQRQNHSMSSISDTMNNNDVRGLGEGRQQFSFGSNREKGQSWSNTQNFHEDSKENKKKKYPCGYRRLCLCLLGSLLTALLLAAAITVALLYKSPNTTTTTLSTDAPGANSTSMIATTILPITTLAATPGNTTFTTTVVTTTSSTTSATTSTTTSCTAPTSGDFSFSNTPQGSYSMKTLNYTAASSGTALLQFSFYSNDGNSYWYLDDVSILDLTVSNSEMLINGGFENGSFAGWALICTSHCTKSAGSIVNSSCRLGGSYCYTDACKGGYDFLEQAFTTTIGHIYMLTFWIYTDNQPQQQAYVSLN